MNYKGGWPALEIESWSEMTLRGGTIRYILVQHSFSQIGMES